MGITVYEYLTYGRWAVSFAFRLTQNPVFRFLFVKILMQSTSMHVCVHVTHVQNWHVFVYVQIHTSLINGRPSADDPSPKLLEFTSARYIRLRLQRIRTLNADLMTLSHRDLRDLDPIVTRRVSICCVPDHLEQLVSGRILWFLLVGYDYLLSFVAMLCRWWPQHPFLRSPCSFLPIPIVCAPGECHGHCPKDPSLVPHPIKLEK